MSCYGSYVLNVTEECNFRCVYCPVNYKPNHITIEKAEEIVEFCIKTTPEPHIAFFGGEPLLVYEEIIKPLILKYSDKVSWGISTNGSLLDKEKLKFFYDYKVRILLSIDGPAEIHDKQRRTKEDQPTYHIIEKYLPIISEFFPQTTFRATCTPLAPEGMIKGYHTAMEKGFKKYYNCAEEFSDKNWTEEKKNILLKGLKEIENIYIDSLNQNQFPTIFLPLHEIINQFLSEEFIINENSCYRCGLGTLSLGFDIYGNIYSCNEHATYEIDNPFCIGNIENGIDKNKLNRLQNQYLNIKCKKCENWKSCRQVCCLSRRYFMFKNFEESSSIWCLWLNALCNMANNIIEACGKEKVLSFIKKYEEKYEYPIRPPVRRGKE